MPFNKQELLYERAMKAKKSPGGTVSFQAFVDVVSLLLFLLFSLEHEATCVILYVPKFNYKHKTTLVEYNKKNFQNLLVD